MSLDDDLQSGRYKDWISQFKATRATLPEERVPKEERPRDTIGEIAFQVVIIGGFLAIILAAIAIAYSLLP